MEIFLIGFLGALTGGILLGLTITLLFVMEKRQLSNKSDKIIKELKNLYNSQMSVRSYEKGSGKANRVN